MFVSYSFFVCGTSLHIMPEHMRPLCVIRSSSQPSSRTTSPDNHIAFPVIVVQNAVRAAESEVTIMEEMLQRTMELVGQSRKELLCRMEEISQKNEDRLQRLEGSRKRLYLPQRWYPAVVGARFPQQYSLRNCQKTHHFLSSDKTPYHLRPGLSIAFDKHLPGNTSNNSSGS